MSEENGKCEDCRKRDYCKKQCRANRERIETEVNALIWRSLLKGFSNVKDEEGAKE